MDRRIKIRHLQAFLVTIHLGSLKAAAEHIHLSQPAVTKALNELEAIVDVKLLARDRGGVALTPEGEVFHQFAQNGLNALNEGLSRLAEMKEGGSASLMIGALPSVAARFLPSVMTRLMTLSPGIRISIEEGPHDILVDKLRAGAIDVVVGRLGPPETMVGIAFTQLYVEHAVCVVRPGHPLAGSDALDRMAEFLIVYPTARSAIRPLVDRFFIANGITAFPQRIEAVSAAFGRGVVYSSDAVWIISEGVVAHDLEAGTLAKMPLDLRITMGPIGMMLRSDEEPNATLQLFKTAVRNVMETEPPMGEAAHTR